MLLCYMTMVCFLYDNFHPSSKKRTGYFVIRFTNIYDSFLLRSGKLNFFPKLGKQIQCFLVKIMKILCFKLGFRIENLAVL